MEPGMKLREVDYLVVGGGSAGSVMAARLSEDARNSVGLLEAGGRGDSQLVKIPAAVVSMLPTRINNYALQTVPQPGLNGRRGYQPRGKALGGSSAINAMVYIRGHRKDYDDWAALGNAGWSYDELLSARDCVRLAMTLPMKIRIRVRAPESR
jgi:choline dehydrogenase-like flavoprotein